MANNRKDSGFSYIAAFSLAFGCIVGWSSFTTPGILFIPRAGMTGTLSGLLIATIIALVIRTAYIGLAESCPEAVSSYQMVREVFGIDHAFFSAWAVLLAYLCIFWANATAVSLVGRFIFGSTFLYKVHYGVMGYDVYPGDIIITALVMASAAYIVSRGYRFTLRLITALALILLLLVILTFIIAATGSDLSKFFSPAFSLTSKLSRGMQIMSVAVLAPLIFVGFETVSHASKDNGLSLAKAFTVAAASIALGTLVFCMLSIITNSGMPDGFRKWEDFVAATGDIGSFEEIPVLYGIRRVMGTTGTILLLIAYLCATYGSVLGFLLSAIRTIKIMADDHLTPKALIRTNKNGVPRNALILVMCVSVPAIFVGMNLLGWALDISTLVICIVYGHVCLGAFLRSGENKLYRICGLTGAFLSFGIFILLIVPGTMIGDYLAKGDYIVLSVWCLAGLICFRFVFAIDDELRMGKSMMMWLFMFFMLFFSTNMWTHEQTIEDMAYAMDSSETVHILTTQNLMHIIIVIIAIILLFELFSVLKRRDIELGKRISLADEKNRRSSTMLLNMSHDIRTPMNAIIGFADIALQNISDGKSMSGYLNKIKTSGTHLLSLINDVLEMNLIENDRLEMHADPVNLPELITHIYQATTGGAGAKDLEYLTDVHPMDDENVICDRNLLRHVLTFLISWAVDNTPDGGKVTAGVMQLERTEDGRAMYEFFVKDNGKARSPKSIKRLTENMDKDEYEFADVGGIELGLSITRKIIKLMGGRAEVESIPGFETAVYVTFEFDISTSDAKGRGEDFAYILSDRRVLIVDDIMVNRQIASTILRYYGMEIEEAKDGWEALERLEKALPGHYDVVLMDIEMPGLNGFAATDRIRNLPDPINSSVPIYAMTANVFDEDMDKAFSAGMNGFIPKPIDREFLINTLVKAFRY